MKVGNKGLRDKMHQEKIKCEGGKLREEMKGTRFSRTIKRLRTKHRRCKWC